LRAQEAQSSLSIGNGRANRLFHFVGNRSRELPHFGDAIGVRELHQGFAVAPLAFAGFSFRPLALGDVACQGNAQPPASLPELSHANLDGEQSSVLSAVATLQAYDFTGLEALLDKRYVCIRIKIDRSHADHFVPAIAQAFASVPVHVENGSVFVVEYERVGRVVYEGAEAGLTRSQFLLGALALGQIEHERDTFLPTGIESRPTDHDGHAAAVLPQVLLLGGLHTPHLPDLCEG
jgi:hypothetical protein